MKNYWLIHGIMIPKNGGKSTMYQVTVCESSLGDGQMYHEVFGNLDVIHFEITPGKIKFKTKEILNKILSIKFDFNVIIDNAWSGIFDCENGYSGTTNCVVVRVDETFFQNKVEMTYIKKV